MTDPRDSIEETETGYLVSIPIAEGFIKMAFEGVEQPKSHEIQCDLTTWQEAANLTPEPFSARLNVLSLNNREAYRRQLDDAFGKGNWTTLLNRTCGMVRAAWQSRDPSCKLEEAPESMQLKALLEPWLVSGPSVLFGQGGSAKTYLALSIALAMAAGEPFLGVMPESAVHVLYVDYEADAGTLKGRLQELKNGRGINGSDVPIHYWPARGQSLADMVLALKRKVRQSRIELVIVDSAGLAAGGEPEKADTAIRYFNALATLEVPSLTIAHETKLSDGKFPFGSIYWNTSARCTWNVKLLQEESGNVSRIGLFNRKSNNSRLSSPVGLRMEWGTLGTTIELESLDREWTNELSVRKRIQLAMYDGAKTLKELNDITGVKQDTLARTLTRYRNSNFIPVGDKKWGLLA